MAAPTLHPPPVATTNTDAFVWQEWFKLLYKQVMANSWQWIKLSANSVVSSTSFTAVSELSFLAKPNTTYLVKVLGEYSNAASTTGMTLSLDIPSGSVIGIELTTPTATTVEGTGQNGDSNTLGTNGGVPGTNTNTPISAEWVVVVGATAGNITLLQKSSVAASATTLKASLTLMGYKEVT